MVRQSQTEILIEQWSSFGKPLNFADSLYAVVDAYIDESEGIQGWFSLACVLTTGLEWTFFSGAWSLKLRRLNTKLRKQGRKEISRFHATDLWSRRDEFEGWDIEERDRFAEDMKETLGGLERGVHTVCASFSVADVADVYSLSKPDQIKRACYAVGLSFMMLELAANIESHLGYQDEKIAMFHDHNNGYDGALQRVFWRMKADPTFRGRHYFKSLVPCEWKDYTPLQAADFVVYENRRNVPNHMEDRELGPHLKSMLKLDNFGGSSFIVLRTHLEEIHQRLGREWLSEV